MNSEESSARESSGNSPAVPRYEHHQGRPVLVYLGDMFHNYTFEGPYTMPLNLGYMAAYVREQLGPNIEVKLFKFPEPLIEAVKNRPPDILAMSNYSWNLDIGTRLARKLKELAPEMLTLMGGPNVDFEPPLVEEFLKERPFVDLYVTHEGEPGFTEAVYRFIRADFDIGRFKSTRVSGCSFLDPATGRLVSGAPFQLNELDAIPSPYLTGVMDEFFTPKYFPLIETNRGCPYPCTFCAWGNGYFNRVRKFSMERVRAELEYIARKCQDLNVSVLFVADANFGMFSERDLEIAQLIHDLYLQYGFPKKLSATWAKNKTNKLLNIAEALRELSPVTVAFQSMDETVLKYIKRSNMKPEHFKKLQGYFEDKGIRSYAQMIVGLPGETRETYIQALSTLLEEGDADIRSFNCMLLKGSEMNTPAYREKYQLKSGWRLMDKGFGRYDDVVSLEPEEMVVATSTMSREDIRFFRPLHWLLQFAQNYGYYSYLLLFFRARNVKAIDFFVNLIEDFRSAPSPVAGLFEQFLDEADHEYFPTQEALFEYYCNEENWRKLASGEYERMNGKYISRIIMECKPEFDQYVTAIARKLVGRQPDYDLLCKIIDEIVRFESNAVIDFLADDLFAEYDNEFLFDIRGWEQNKFDKELEKYFHATPVTYTFHIPQRQQRVLLDKLKIFEGCSPTKKVRGMTIDLGQGLLGGDFKYKILRPVNQVPA